VSFEVFAQQDGGCDVVEVLRRAAASRKVSCFRHRLPSLPAGEALVGQFDGEAQIFSDARGKCSRFVRHFAGFAGDVQRMAHEDTRDAVLRANVAKEGEVGAAIFAIENGERARGEAELVGNGETDALTAIVERKDALRRGAGRRHRWRGLGHRMFERNESVNHRAS
jgi:hypothetical protein